MRPDYIGREDFRDWKTSGGLKKLFRVGGWQPYTYILKCEESGRPLPHKIHDGSRRWRAVDIYARAMADALSFSPPIEKEQQIDADAMRVELERLRSRVSEMRHRLEWQDIGFAITGAAPATRHDILAAVKPIAKSSGIYFLVKDREIVYVGQSVNVPSRISTHLSGRHGDIDGYAYLPCSIDKLDAVESLYIHMLQPPRNGRVSGESGNALAPLSMHQLIGRIAGQQRLMEVVK